MGLVTKEKSGSRWRIRPDGPAKVTGSLVYLTDMRHPKELIGAVLRSEHPHALIRSISTEKAAALPGVRAVLTWRDVPGLNGFGIAKPDQPVFCEDKVRYVGDAVAAVAADTREIAAEALGLIEVDYELLPVVDDPEAALEPDSPDVHAQGNLLHRNDFSRGDVEAAFAECAVVVEETYVTPRQMHTYMETEGGLFVPEEDGRLSVYSPTQHGYKDRMQLARILGWQEDRIRVLSSPIGGSFGGKDELNVQPYGSLLALATGRPVRIHHSRWESVRAGLKRHPMKITMRTGLDAQGRIAAHRVRIVADTGAYATLGAEVLNYCVEHTVGSYRFGAVDVSAFSVYTNNGVSGEFRGFGGNQAIFALEGQMDRLAEAIGEDPMEFRKRHVRLPEDPGPFGQRIAATSGPQQVFEALAKSPIWLEKNNPRTGQEREPWIRTGIGAAFVMHGAGLGVGIPDPSAGRLRLAKDGKIEAVFGFEEFGQGVLATLELMMIERFGLSADDFRLVIGDTDVVPHSGSSTASRVTSMMWACMEKLQPAFIARLTEAAAEALGGVSAATLKVGSGGIRRKETGELAISYPELAALSPEPIECETHIDYPIPDHPKIGSHYMYSYSAVAVKVEVDGLTGRAKVVEQFHAVAAGPVMNPQGYVGQIEGGAGMALGFTLTEEAVMSEGRYLTRNLDTYFVPTISDLNGNVTVEAIEDLPEGDPHGPRGIGELGSVGLAAAIASAVSDAVPGLRIAKLPIEPEKLQFSPFEIT